MTTPITPAVQQDGNDPRRGFRSRVLLLKLVFSVFFVAVTARLLEVQVIEAGKFQALARKQYEQKFALPATRGAIHDRNGNVLVSNTRYVSFAADPKILGDNADLAAAVFSRVFGRPVGTYLEKLRDDNRRFVWLERRVKPELARRVEHAGIDGLVVMNEPKRLYHYDDLAGTLIGFTDIDGKGIAGLEWMLNGELRGTAGSVTMQRDGLGRVRPSADYPRIEPRNGYDVELTIDLAYQAVVDEELRRGIAANRADGGLAVMLNPRSGEVLALSVVPGVHPGEVHAPNAVVVRNRVVTDVFEPGSVFKLVTAAVGYEQDIVRPDTRYFAERGSWKVPLNQGRFRLIKDTHEHEWLTFEVAVGVSSNIVMAKVSKLIGPERLYRAARDFGFGLFTGVDIPGEVRGRLKRPNEWSGTTLQTMSYGYEVGVTPLQIVAAYGAVANGGVLMRPFVVSRVRTDDGTLVREQFPQAIRQVVSDSTCVKLTRAFEGVVESGSGMEARVNGVRIAGKTGTSRKLVDGKYSYSNYTASFVGYFPVEDPQVVLLVMMDNPRARGYYGGSTSGPVFKAVAERVIASSSRFSRTVAAALGKDRRSIAVPDVRMLKAPLAQTMVSNQGLTSRVFGPGTVVVKQSPEPGAMVEPGDVISLVLHRDGEVPQGGMRVPDVRGMSLRRAINRLVVDDFDVSVRGTGVVARQDPGPGQRIRSGATITLLCEPRNLANVTLY